MGVSGKEGSFDIMESTETKKAKKVNTMKNLFIAVLILVVIGLAVKVGISNSYENSMKPDDEEMSYGRPLPSPNVKDRKNVCMTAECIAASHRLFEHMNLKADPCEDFNEFACGKFQKEFRIPEDKSRYSSFTPAGEVLYERGRTILEEEETDEDWNVFKQAKRLYKSCMDEDKLDQLGLTPLTNVLEEFGGWPVLKGDNWANEDAYKWYEKMPELSKRGFGKDFFVAVSVGTDDKNSSWRAVFVDQPSLGMSREYLVKGFDDEDVQKYLTYMIDTVKLLGGNEAKAKEDMEAVLRFEIKLAEASAPREERRNATKLYNPVVLNEFQQLEGHPPSWADYINQVVIGQEIPNHERVIVSDPGYIKKMGNILKSTSNRVIANYVGWRVSKSLLGYLNKDAEEITLKYTKALTGAATAPPRWKKCVKAVGFNSYTFASFRIPVATMYVKRHFTKEAKEAMLDMIRYLKLAFGKIVDDLDWMDDETKKRAKKKLNKMDQFIGYPDEILVEDNVEELYKSLKMDTNDYLGNSVQLSLWNRNYKYGRLREKVDKKSWKDHSLVAVVNAFYSGSTNSMEFPAGILQGTFFNHLVPKYLNFGAIGAVIGHEITHGFDDQGRQYDYEGINIKIIQQHMLIFQYFNF